MKKMIKISFLTMMATILLLLTNCKKNDETDFQIVGTWKYLYHYEELYSDNILIVRIDDLPYKSITFNKNGTGIKTKNEGGILDSIKWRFVGDTIMIGDPDSSGYNEFLRILKKTSSDLETLSVGKTIKMINGEEREFVAVINSFFRK